MRTAPIINELQALVRKLELSQNIQHAIFNMQCPIIAYAPKFLAVGFYFVIDYWVLSVECLKKATSWFTIGQEF